MRTRSFVQVVQQPLLTSAIIFAVTCTVVRSQEPASPKPEKDATSKHSVGADGELAVDPDSTLTIPMTASMSKKNERTFELAYAPKNPFARSLRERNASVPKRQASSDPGWEFAFAPYLYMTGITGTVGARGRTAQIDLDFTDVLEHLNLGLMGAFEARKGRLVLTNDFLWIKLGEERDTPGQLFSSIKLGVNMVIIDPEIGYRVYAGDRASFDMLGGVRVMSVETNLNFRAGILPADDVSERKTWATPVIGGRGVFNVTPKFFLSTKFDVGGGVGADFTGQFYGGGGYRIKPRIALIGGYRYMRTDYDSAAGFVFDTTMNGILVGAKFSF